MNSVYNEYVDVVSASRYDEKNWVCRYNSLARKPVLSECIDGTLFIANHRYHFDVEINGLMFFLVKLPPNWINGWFGPDKQIATQWSGPHEHFLRITYQYVNEKAYMNCDWLSEGF